MLAQSTSAQDVLERRRRQQLLRCATTALANVGRTQPYTAALRFIEIYAREEDCASLLHSGYYHSVMSLFCKHYQLPKPLTIEESLSARNESLLELLLLPIQRSAEKSTAVCNFIDTICKQQFEAQAVCCVVPFLGRLCKSGRFDFVDVTHALWNVLGDLSALDEVTAIRIAYCVTSLASAAPLGIVKFGSFFMRFLQQCNAKNAY
ncbi:unnamed protein product [Gongylonema pulchrum]|uniref:Serine/threonine-protein kinase ATR n=1 Tax=Gongylonema pulchrum TaxID=637853 RepID=A0A183D7H3_9BILA|nr:unnamed protein product [Gongylonema pulchrum]